MVAACVSIRIRIRKVFPRTLFTRTKIKLCNNRPKYVRSTIQWIVLVLLSKRFKRNWNTIKRIAYKYGRREQRRQNQYVNVSQIKSPIQNPIGNRFAKTATSIYVTNAIYLLLSFRKTVFFRLNDKQALDKSYCTTFLWIHDDWEGLLNFAKIGIFLDYLKLFYSTGSNSICFRY